MRAVEPPPKGAEERPSLVKKGLPSLLSIIRTRCSRCGKPRLGGWIPLVQHNLIHWLQGHHCFPSAMMPFSFRLIGGNKWD